MPLLASEDLERARAIAAFGHCNPFLPERTELERRALGDAFVDGPFVRQRQPNLSLAETFPNAIPIGDLGWRLLASMREALVSGTPTSESELVLYEDLGLVSLYSRYMSRLAGLVSANLSVPTEEVPAWDEFRDEFLHWFRLPCVRLPSGYDPVHAFACFFQIERAYAHVFDHIVGGSTPVVKLRAAIWESVFTHNTKRYARSLYRRMELVPSLVIGPSGSGKELVARAIGLSRYIPFDPKSRRFVSEGAFHAVNTAALAPTLVESELFGHRKGAFTGAISDRTGWLEACDELGTVFLDEIGDVERNIQVKLLRALQERRFQRLGETREREFRGKLVAATNRDLAEEMQAGRFREDLYYRLCADVVRTPSLREQLADSPDDLPNLVRFAVSRLLDPEDPEHASLATEVVEWIEKRLGRDYAWPGNFRELEQCVRNVMIRREYHPATTAETDAGSTLAAAVRRGELSSKELLERYCRHVCEQAGGYKPAARRLGIDWRTVKKHSEAAAW